MLDHQPREHEVLRLAEARASAEGQGDTARLRELLAEDFIGVGPRGFLLTKEQWLARHASGDLKTESLAWDEVRGRVYGDAAVVIGRETSQGSYQGRETQGQFRTTLVFVRQQGRWVLASLHLSPFAQAS